MIGPPPDLPGLAPGGRASPRAWGKFKRHFWGRSLRQQHPADIERALKNDYSAEPEKRNLQLEARAHIAVQQWIDEGGLNGRATTAEGICEIHRRFAQLLPEDLLWVEDPDTGERIRVTPGALRESHVRVGRHVPVSPGALPRFLERFEIVYGHLGKADSILAAAAAHHRLLWIHPFLDATGALRA